MFGLIFRPHDQLANYEGRSKHGVSPTRIDQLRYCCGGAKHLCTASEGVGDDSIPAGDRDVLLSPYWSPRAARVGDDSENLTSGREEEGRTCVLYFRSIRETGRHLDIHPKCGIFKDSMCSYLFVEVDT